MKMNIILFLNLIPLTAKLLYRELGIPAEILLS
jgi:hypothetical protein